MEYSISFLFQFALLFCCGITSIYSDKLCVSRNSIDQFYLQDCSTFISTDIIAFHKIRCIAMPNLKEHQFEAIIREGIMETNATLIFQIDENDGRAINQIYSTPFCWAQGTISQNYDGCNMHNFVMCGARSKNSITMLAESTIVFKRIKHFDPFHMPIESPSTWSFFPAALAAEEKEESVNEKKSRSTRHTAQPSKRKSERNLHAKTSKEKAEKSDDDEEPPQLSKEDKVRCKYRKSCYYGGLYEPAESVNTMENRTNSPSSSQENEDEEQIVVIKNSLMKNSPPAHNDDNVEIDEEQQRLLCKYRPSCYAERWPNLLNSAKLKKKHTASILTSKPSSSVPSPSTFRKPTNVKEIAKQTLREMEEKERKSIEKPRPKFSAAQKSLLESKERKKHKIICKYRKSCYETGILPPIEPSLLTLWFGSSSTQEIEETKKRETKLFEEPVQNEKDFGEMSTAERKLYCRYRKSCYESGLRPIIDDQKKFHYEEMIHPKRVNKQQKLELRCKYRKSCYETGILPDLRKTPVEAKENEKALKRKPMPTTMAELKLLCKYRKSCYVSKAREAEAEKDEEEKPVKEATNIIIEEDNRNSQEKPRPEKKSDEGKIEKVAKVRKTKRTPQVKIRRPVETKPEKNPLQEPIPRAKKNEDYCGEEKMEGTPPKRVQKKKTEEKKAKKSTPLPPITPNTEEIPEKSEKEERKPAKEEVMEKLQKTQSETEVVGYPLMIAKTLKLACKYRKTCYEKEGYTSQEDNTQTQQKTPPMLRNQEIKEGERRNQQLTPQIKSKCKYRHSCYANLADADIVLQQNWSTKNEQIQRQERLERASNKMLPCNKYYLSCREKLGLPPKEPKAPRAANGKKLCRKKKEV